MPCLNHNIGEFNSHRGAIIMFRCPFCGAMARTRTSRRLSDHTIRQYHQCQNLECSESFTTLNAFERRVSSRDATAMPPPAAEG